MPSLGSLLFGREVNLDWTLSSRSMVVESLPGRKNAPNVGVGFWSRISSLQFWRRSIHMCQSFNGTNQSTISENIFIPSRNNPSPPWVVCQLRLPFSYHTQMSRYSPLRLCPILHSEDFWIAVPIFGQGVSARWREKRISRPAHCISWCLSDHVRREGLDG